MKSIKFLFLILLLSLWVESNAQWTTSGNNIYNSNSGNVGIGTGTTPSSILHLKQTTSTILSIETTLTTGYSGLGLMYNAGTNANLFTYGATYASGTYSRANGTSLHTTAGSGGAGGLALAARHTSGYITFHTGGDTERMRIASDGKVGIGPGSSAPAEALHVFGSLRGAAAGGAIRVNTTSGYLDMGAMNTTYAHFQTDRAKFYFNKLIEVAGPVSSYSTNHLYLRSGGVDRVTIMTSGNVGIGTTEPDALLAVNGRIHAEEVVVDLLVPGPDYVFEPDYELPSLEQIQSFVTANRHLPDVPSAKEMEEEGINVGEMNMLLLKKVEELTLYMIEMKNSNDSLQQKVVALEATLNAKEEKK